MFPMLRPIGWSSRGQLWGPPPSREGGLGAAWTGWGRSSLVCMEPHPFWLVGRHSEEEPRPGREHSEDHKQNSNSVGLN